MSPLARIVCSVLLLGFVANGRGAEFKVGVASVDVTPDYPIRLSGYAVRKSESEGVSQRLHTKAIAVQQDGGETALFMTVDNVGITKEIHDQVARDLESKHKIAADHLVIFSSHTHSAPCLSNAIGNLFVADLPADQLERINRYTKELVGKIETAAAKTIEDLAPAKISWGKGKVGFAKNRRTEGGPVDHDLPVLVFKKSDGKLKAVLANYACHCTTLGGEWNKLHADWAGFAQEYIEKSNPGAVGLVSIGCGADANPFPRGKIENADEHGNALAKEVQAILGGPLTELTEKIEFHQAEFDLPFDPLPTREEWEKRAKEQGIVGFHAKKNLGRLDRGEKLPTTLPYQVSTWNFGKQLAMVFLPGEVVVDYSLRLKREFDPERLWVSGYANWVPCYIPSERVLKEGGYEAETSLWYYDRPARLSPKIENMIIGAVHEKMPEKFHAARNFRESPEPKSPQQSLASIRVTPDLKVELVAAEPLVESPVAIDWSADGKLWVVEMRDFPQGMDGNWKPGGRVKVLEDLNGDSVYDKATVFLDGIPFPTGITCWKGGALVCAAPDILFASDTNGDGKADEVKKMFSGFATDNYQARVNSLSLGLDGWFYGANGLIGGTISGGAIKSPMNISNRDFRFQPETGEFETASGLTQQGRVRDDFGNWFGCDNSTLIWHYPLPEEFLRRNQSFAPPATRVSLAAGKDPNQLYPISVTLERFNEPGQANRTTSACGLGIYRDHLLGEDFYGNAFVCEPVHNLVRRMKLEPDGASFKATRLPENERNEFLASYDNWFRPVQARNGPEGALWIVDMYRFVVEHPRWITPERLKTLDIRAGADKGRIYRVYPKNKNVEPIRNIASMKTIELVGRLNSPNGTERDRIQLELMRRKEKSATSGLAQIVQSRAEPAIRIQAFSALESLDQAKASDLVKALLADTDSEVRAFAISAAARLKINEEELLAQNGEPSAKVALQLAFALGNNYDSSATKALAEILLKHGNDPWVRSAVLSSSAGRGLEIFEMVRSSGDAELLHNVARPLIAAAVSSGKDQGSVLRSVIPENSKWEPWQLEAARQVLDDVAKDSKRRSQFLAEPGMREIVAQISAAARKIALDENVAVEARATAVSLLGFDESSKAILLELIANATASQIQNTAAESLIGQNSLDDVLKEWGTLTPSARRALITATLKRTELISPFLAYLEKNGSLGELSTAQRQQLKKHRREEIREIANRLFPDSKSREQIIDRYRSALSMTGNPENGSRLFAANCASCHLFRGQGYAVGPNLAALTDKSGQFLLTAILDPNAAVENRYVSYTVETKDGREVVGLVGEETAGSITVRLAGGQKEPILRRDIQSLKASNLSLMPEGLEQNATPHEIADLISFLQLGPAPFGSADASRVKRALASFQPTPFRVVSATEKLPYPSWLGRLALAHCRQTDGRSAVSWEVRPETNAEVFRFPIALGFISNPSGSFEFLINGKPCLSFNVQLDDTSWESKDKSVRLNYFVMERNEEDSNGILSVYLDPALVHAGETITFTVKGSASNSQRWFGVYELPQEIVSAKK